MKVVGPICAGMFLLLAAGGASGKAGAPSAEPYLSAVRRFADVAIERGRDGYGEKKTPLFVDGLHARTLAPAVWKGIGGEDWVLSNFASQQALMRTLDGLTGLTGEAKYRAAAEETARYALEHLSTPNGLLYWGGHLAWDLEHEKAVGQGGPNTHEMKGNQPHYELLWRVNPQATRRLVETIWAGHVLDWRLLDYNRHAAVARPALPKWESAFDDTIQVPFPSVGENLSFVNVVMPLMHAGVSLAILGESDEAQTWTRRLLHRWQEGRDPKTGLCGGQLSYRRNDRAFEALGHVHPTINEARIVATYHQVDRYHELPLAQLQAAEDLLPAGPKRAALGRELIEWASDDLKVYARRSYDRQAGHFVALMTDGTPLRWQESRKGYYVPDSFAPRQPDGLLLWAYATAYRVTRDEAHWEMARELAMRLELGDLGRPDGGRKLAAQPAGADYHLIYGLLELYRATKDPQVLALACRVGDNLLKLQAESGLFPRPGRDYARTGDEVPLALLHLAAAVMGKGDALPRARFDNAFFHCVYHGELQEHQKKRDDARTYDHYVFYGRP